MLRLWHFDADADETVEANADETGEQADKANEAIAADDAELEADVANEANKAHKAKADEAD